MTESRLSIRMGLQIPNFTYPGVEVADLFERVSAMAVTAESSGFDSVFVMDHFYQLPMLGAPDQDMFEAYSLLNALAARTSTVNLGVMVGGMTYRNPAYLAKVVTALDVFIRQSAQQRVVALIRLMWLAVHEYPSGMAQHLAFQVERYPVDL